MTLTLVVVVVTPVSFVIHQVMKKSYHFFKQQSEIRGDQTAYMNEMIEEHEWLRPSSKQESH